MLRLALHLNQIQLIALLLALASLAAAAIDAPDHDRQSAPVVRSLASVRTTRAPTHAPHAPRKLAVALFSGPVDAEVNVPFNVWATACDDGLNLVALRVSLNSDLFAQFVPTVNPLTGKPNPCVSGKYEISWHIKGRLAVHAQAFGSNGTRGPIYEHWVTLHAPDNLTNANFNPYDQVFIDRLVNTDYPMEVGSLANINVISNVLVGPWWMNFYASQSRVPFNTAKCNPPVIYPRIKSRTRVFWPQSTTNAILACWLATYPNVAGSISWDVIDPTKGPLCSAPVECPVAIHMGVVTHLPYADWTPAMKSTLNSEFYYAYRWLFYGTLEPFLGTAIPDVPDNQIAQDDADYAYTLLSNSDAWNLYINNIAHSLAMEIGGFSKFSVVKYQVADLAILFNSTSFFNAGFFWWSVAPAHTQVRAYVGYWVDYILPAPAQTTFAFMIQHDVPRPAAKNVLEQLFTWGRNNTLRHTYETTPEPGYYISDGDQVLGAQTYWQYRGVTPAARVMTGTEMFYPYPIWVAYIQGYMNYTDGPASWVLGCYGTSFFLQATLRAHNVPTQVTIADEGQTGHTVPFWFTVGYTMSHGDDLYDSDGWATPPANSVDFLLPLSTFHYWLYDPAGMIGPGGIANVGRQPDVEIAIKYLTNNLVQAYCMDKASNAPIATGLVYTEFFLAGATEHVPGTPIPYYSVAQLQALNLWTRLDTKAAALSLC